MFAETVSAADGVQVERFPVGKHRANAYLAHGGSGSGVVVIDPGGDATMLVDRIRSLSLHVDAIVLTHAHWDHVGAAQELAEWSGAPVYLHSADERLLKQAPIYAFRVDGDRLTLPKRVELIANTESVAIQTKIPLHFDHAPGHTAGGLTVRVGRAVLTGDTLMREAVGRTNFPGGDAVALERSLTSLAATLRDDDQVCPGHGRTWAGHEAKAWLASGVRAAWGGATP